VRHNNSLLLRLSWLRPFSRSHGLQLPPQGADRLNRQDKAERKLADGKHARIRNVSSPLELVVLGIAILLPLCSELSMWTATERDPCSPVQPAFLAVLLSTLNPASQSHEENTTCLPFPPPVTYLFYFHSWCRKKSDKVSKERTTETQERQGFEQKHMRKKNKTLPKEHMGQ